MVRIRIILSGPDPGYKTNLLRNFDIDLDLGKKRTRYHEDVKHEIKNANFPQNYGNYAFFPEQETHLFNI